MVFQFTSSFRDSFCSFMDEVFQTVRETPEGVEAIVSGTIPRWLTGTLLRNGPAKYEFAKHDYKHWFDGLALLHSFTIDKDKVVYRSKYIRSEAYLKGEEKNRIVFTEFGTAQVPDPCQSIFARFFSSFTRVERTDNCAVNIFNMKGKLYANSDSPFMTEIDLKTLNRLDILNTQSDLKIGNMVYACAHPHEGPDGSVYQVMSSVGRHPKYNIIEIPPSKRANHVTSTAEAPLSGAKLLASIPSHNQLCYYHSFGMTPNYFIFVENPFMINAFEVVTMKVAHRSFHDCIHWETKQPSRFYLIKRHSKVPCVTMFETRSFFAFHHVNAYESDNDVIVDLVCYPDATIINQYYLYHLRSSKLHEVGEGFPDGEIRRYKLPLQKGHSNDSNTRLRYEILANSMELPRINYTYNGQPYRYVYSCGPREHGHFFNQLIKLDILTKEQRYWYEIDCYPSEPVFVSKPGCKDEDDGVVISLVIGTRGKQSFMLVLDASLFQELARATITERIPQSLHGNFIPSLNYQLEAFHAKSSKATQ